MRQMLPVRFAVTNRSPPGPRALPCDSTRPVTSRRFSAAATCFGAPSRFREAGSLASGRDSEAGAPHAARGQTNRGEKAMRYRIVTTSRGGERRRPVRVTRPAAGAAPPIERPPLKTAETARKAPHGQRLTARTIQPHYRAEQLFLVASRLS